MLLTVLLSPFYLQGLLSAELLLELVGTIDKIIDDVHMILLLEQKQLVLVFILIA